MKRFTIAIMSLVLIVLAGQAQAGVLSGETCTTHITYVIKDSNGNERTNNVYHNQWPWSCEVSVATWFAVVDVLVKTGDVVFKDHVGATTTDLLSE